MKLLLICLGFFVVLFIIIFIIQSTKIRELSTKPEAGVQWADVHPKSPCISVNDDLPCNHQDLTH